MSSLLAVEHVTLEFGGIRALHDVSLEVHDREVVALIGPNGAGKTSLLNVISRLYEPTAGSVTFDGRAVLDVPDHRIPALGIARTFQNLALFPALTVLENVALGASPRGRMGLLRTFLCMPGSRIERDRALDEATHQLDRLGLAHLAGERPADLPPGLLRKVELARALVARPQLVLLDEPAAGLNEHEIAMIVDVVRDTNRADAVTVLLIDHRMDLVMSLAQRIVVLDFGEVIAEGTPDEIRRDDRVIEAYLGSIVGG